MIYFLEVSIFVEYTEKSSTFYSSLIEIRIINAFLGIKRNKGLFKSFHFFFFFVVIVYFMVVEIVPSTKSTHTNEN